MVTLVNGNNLVEAWKAGSQKILAAPNHRLQNLVTEITRPINFQADWMTRYSPQSVGERDSVSVVAKVLFPPHPRRSNQTRENYYAHWRTVLERTRKSGALKAPWGTYFDRLVAFDGQENQIEGMIKALSTWGGSPPVAALVAHTSAPTLDSLKPIGSPCLQYIEVLRRGRDIIDLVAIYRNHDFLNKAFGNFIGLARLLNFIAAESGKITGTLTCHSVHAYCDRPTKLRTLIS